MNEFSKVKFKFQNPGKLIYSSGSIKKTRAELAALGSSRLMLVTDEVLGSSEIVEWVKESLAESLVAVYDKAIPDSDVDVVNQGAALARERGVDGIVSVGGGSSIDTAKAISVLVLKKADNILDHLGFYQLGEKVIPHAAIPTTAGTGSECTGVAVIKDRQAGIKRLLVDDNIIPDVAILDPMMVKSLPANITAATGMDALTHAIEAMVSTRSMPPADALAAHAIRMIINDLPRAVENGEDMDARGSTLVASALAGQAFQNAYVGVVHALAHAIGGKYGVPHGAANALLLAPGMEYNLSHAETKLARVAHAMGVPDSGDARTDARSAIEGIRKLTKTIGLDKGLKEWGVQEDGLKECAKIALADASIFTNPRRAEGPEELVEIYRAAM